MLDSWVAVAVLVGATLLVQECDAFGGFMDIISYNVQAFKQLANIEVLNTISPICGLVKSALGVNYNQLEAKDDIPDIDALDILFRTKFANYSYNVVNAATAIPNSPGYCQDCKIVIYIHGFQNQPTSDPISKIGSAFLATGDYNVLALDASIALRKYYLRASTYTSLIGERLAKLLAQFVQNGVDPYNILVVGHSLGAHIAGNTGYNYHQLTGLKLKRITGLDPAGPCFLDIDTKFRLSHNDADYVDVIHTNAGFYGTTNEIGDADFFVNGGTFQPQCNILTCEHLAAIDYYVESIMRPSSFLALSCEDWQTFKNHKCDDSRVSIMGYGSQPDSKGRFYLQTYSSEPYGKGELGIYYEN